MRSGIVRKIDDLGRIVLPVELRKELSISYKDTLEIYIENDSVIIRKYNPTDIFTGETEDLIEYMGKKVSKKSILEMCRIADINVNECHL